MNEEQYKDLWAEIIGTPRPHRVVDFPRVNPKTGQPFQIAMVVLTAEESALVTASAERKVRKVLKGDLPQGSEARKGYDELFNDFCTEGVLYESVRNPNDLSKRFFPTPGDISKVLTMDELAILINHYYTVQTLLGPVISELNEEQLEIWIKRLMEAGTQPPFLLNSCSLEVMKALVMHLVNQLKILQTSKLSSISLPEDTTQNNKDNEDRKPEKDQE